MRFMLTLVTGAAGYIGSNLSLLLREKGHEVVGLDAFTDYYPVAIKRHTAERLDGAGVPVHELDLAESSLEAVLEGVDSVVHLAAQPGISATTPWSDYHRNNIVATHRLVEACKKVEGLKFLNVATSSCYGLHATDAEDVAPKPASWYGATKLGAEQEALAMHRSGKLSAASVRLFSVYGERERPEKLFPRIIGAIANDEAFPLYDGSWDHKRSFTYVGDICEGIICALENWDKAQGEIFNLGTDACFTTGEAIEAVQEAMGKKANIDVKPPRPGDQAATHANIDKIRSRLGWEPKTGLVEGVERTVKWYMDEVHGKLDWR